MSIKNLKKTSVVKKLIVSQLNMATIIKAAVLICYFAATSAATFGVCVLEGSARGTIQFESIDGGRTRVTGTVSGLSPGLHGFHVHEFGDYTSGCVSMGAHFNPQGREHGGPADVNRHAGDLGNVLANAAGVATVDIVDAQIPLDGPNSIMGRSVVVHADPDDLGRGGYPDSKTTGHSGGRVACGVIGYSNGR